jgi:hypothetical protein
VTLTLAHQFFHRQAHLRRAIGHPPPESNPSFSAPSSEQRQPGARTVRRLMTIINETLFARSEGPRPDPHRRPGGSARQLVFPANLPE